MSKIKIVQIAFYPVTSRGESWGHAQYLDDKGRLWERGFDLDTGETIWRQIVVPDEPKESN